MATITKNQTAPPPATFTFELSQEEANALYLLLNLSTLGHGYQERHSALVLPIWSDMHNRLGFLADNIS